MHHNVASNNQLLYFAVLVHYEDIVFNLQQKNADDSNEDFGTVKEHESEKPSRGEESLQLLNSTSSTLRKHFDNMRE